MLRLIKLPNDRGAQGGQIEMSLGSAPRFVEVERVLVVWVARPQSLAFGRAAHRNAHALCRRSTDGHQLAASG